MSKIRVLLKIYNFTDVYEREGDVFQKKITLKTWHHLCLCPSWDWSEPKLNFVNSMVLDVSEVTAAHKNSVNQWIFVEITEKHHWNPLITDGAVLHKYVILKIPSVYASNFCCRDTEFLLFRHSFLFKTTMIVSKNSE